MLSSIADNFLSVCDVALPLELSSVVALTTGFVVLSVYAIIAVVSGLKRQPMLFCLLLNLLLPFLAPVAMSFHLFLHSDLLLEVLPLYLLTLAGPIHRQYVHLYPFVT